jgi:hypothetical protein
MTRFVTFGGQTQFKPGGLTRINANALTPIGLSATGIVHLLGEADGGPPGTEGLVIIDDPALAKQYFRSGPLADAVRVAFTPSGDPRIPGGAFRIIAYKTNGGTKSGVQLPGDEAIVSDTDAGGSTTTVVNLVTGGLVVDSQIGRWALINGEYRRIVDNDAASITLDPPLTVAPTASDVVAILNSQLLLESADWGSHTNQVSVELEPGVGEGFVVTLAFEDTVERSDEIGGTSFLNLKYLGGAQTDTGTVDTASDPTGATIELDVAVAPGVDAWAGQLVRFSNGLQRLISANTAADPSVITFAAGHALSTAEQAAVQGTTAEIINVTSADASIQGGNGEAATLVSTVAPVDDPLNISFSAGMTLRQLVDEINGTTNYEATVPDGVNPDTTLMETFDFGTRATNVDVRFDDAVDPDNNGTFRRDLQVLIDWINEFSDLATATRASTGVNEGAEVPRFTGGVSGTVRDVPVYFTGGTRGTSGNSDFQAGFDALIETRGNFVVPLISQDLENEGYGSTADIESVAAQLLEHVKKARTADKNEMGGFLGYKGDIDAILAQIAAINDTDVQLVPQQMAFLDVDGNLKLMDEWAAGVAAAGMKSGANEVGEPLTFKFIGTSQLEQDSSWSPTNRTDVNRLLAGGCMFAEAIASGVRWVRDLTTHIKDDNIAFIDGNTRDAVRFVAYDLRTFLEDRFTGVKATPATVASIRESAAAQLATYLENNIIVESLDPETQSSVIPGFRRLRVFIEGNVATIRVEIFPVTGIVFQLNDIFLQLPRLAG